MKYKRNLFRAPDDDDPVVNSNNSQVDIPDDIDDSYSNVDMQKLNAMPDENKMAEGRQRSGNSNKYEFYFGPMNQSEWEQAGKPKYSYDDWNKAGRPNVPYLEDYADKNLYKAPANNNQPQELTYDFNDPENSRAFQHRNRILPADDSGVDSFNYVRPAHIQQAYDMLEERRNADEELSDEEWLKKFGYEHLAPAEREKREKAVERIEGMRHLGRLLGAFGNLYHVRGGSPSQKYAEMPTGVLSEWRKKQREDMAAYQALRDRRDADYAKEYNRIVGLDQREEANQRNVWKAVQQMEQQRDREANRVAEKQRQLDLLQQRIDDARTSQAEKQRLMEEKQRLAEELAEAKKAELEAKRRADEALAALREQQRDNIARGLPANGGNRGRSGGGSSGGGRSRRGRGGSGSRNRGGRSSSNNRGSSQNSGSGGSGTPPKRNRPALSSMFN